MDEEIKGGDGGPHDHQAKSITKPLEQKNIYSWHQFAHFVGLEVILFLSLMVMRQTPHIMYYLPYLKLCKASEKREIAS